MNPLELNTSRLKLCLVEQSDLILVHHLHSLPETDEFNTLGIPKNREETKALLDA
jgi:ribosomal-protein-alanine N-acetyltransferase